MTPMRKTPHDFLPRNGTHTFPHRARYFSYASLSYVERGTYQKGRKRITEPVLVVDPAKAPIMEPHDDVLQEVKEYLGIPEGSKPPMYVSKTQGWAIAALLSVLAVGVTVATYVGFKRDYEADQNHRQLQEIKARLDDLHRAHQKFERQLVKHDTEIENLKDKE